MFPCSIYFTQSIYLSLVHDFFLSYDVLTIVSRSHADIIYRRVLMRQPYVPCGVRLKKFARCLSTVLRNARQSWYIRKNTYSTYYYRTARAISFRRLSLKHRTIVVRLSSPLQWIMERIRQIFHHISQRWQQCWRYGCRTDLRFHTEVLRQPHETERLFFQNSDRTTAVQQPT